MQNIERRRTTILAADLVGYSRLIARDEEGVVSRLRATMSEAVIPCIAAANGRIIKTMGDGLLAEFPTPMAALRLAIELQTEIVRREANLSEKERFRFRVGINEGEVLIDGEDVLGDVVNVAARLEGLAQPGGVCISKSVYVQVADLISEELFAMGPQRVKNLPTLIEAWQAIFGDLTRPNIQQDPRGATTLAVLPFYTQGPDPDQAVLAEGIVEDVLTELSRFRFLKVISRNSTFALDPHESDLAMLADQLGVHYVVRGALQQSEKRVRVSATLVDVTTGENVWAEKFDGDKGDVFDLQDTLAAAIIAGVAPQVGAHERYLARRKPTGNLSAWEMTQRAVSEFYRYTPDSHLACGEFLDRAIALDPNFSLPYSYIARLMSFRVNSGMTNDPRADIGRGLAAAGKAIVLDDRNELAFSMRGLLLAMSGQQAEARTAINRAEQLNPNNAELYFAKYSLELFAPDPDTMALELAVQELERLSPNDPGIWAREISRGYAYLIEDNGFSPRFQQVAERAAQEQNAPYFPAMFAAACALKIDSDPDKARSYMDAALKLRPDLSTAAFPHLFQFPSWSRVYDSISADLGRLRELGLPES